jgi:uncharacterized membrane protein
MSTKRIIVCLLGGWMMFAAPATRGQDGSGELSAPAQTVARPAPDRLRCLVLFGLFTHILNLDDALADWKHPGESSRIRKNSENQHTETPNSHQSGYIGAVEIDWANCPPNGVETFPATRDQLSRYNAVVLSDVNRKALGDVALEMVCDYVHHGGRLLVVGGPYAYGNGEFEDTRFLELLPVELSGPFDLKRAKPATNKELQTSALGAQKLRCKALKGAGRGKSWELMPAKADHPVLKGVSFDEKPCAFWHHFVTPKENSEVVLKAGEQPALVLGTYGKGKVAVLTLSPTGMGAEGEIPWWDWDGWFPLVRNIFTWLTEVEDQR